MKPSAVLLIDLENFFLSRVQYFNQKGIAPTNRPSFADDFERLITFAQRMAGGPFAVRRAYADYATLRAGPRDLMRQGVEPVQVFRLSGSKNAADMRMAMDAAALLNGAGQIDHFILVTGDGDFIPVILELKRHGHTVSVIGVTGATNELLQRFVDNFELYEDLLAAEEVEARTGAVEQTADSLAHVAACVRKLLAQKGSLRFAAVKPLLSKELGHPFDPGAFGCDTTGEFLQKYQTELGVVIRQTQHDKELDLPSAAVAPPTNGTNGSKVGPKPPARIAEKVADKPAPKPSGPEHHTPIHYMQLLTGRGQAASAVGTVRVPAVSWAAIAWAADTLAVLLAPPRGEPTHTTKLLPKLVTASDKSNIPDLVKQLRAIYPILRAGLGAQPPDGVYALPEGATGESVRRDIFQYIGYVLKCRLADTGVTGEARPDVLAAVFDPGADLERATAEIAAALAEPPPVEAVPEPAPVAPPKPRPVPSADDHHTAATYAKLLKAGGAKGSDTELYKVLPVPWPSVERVCTDLVPLMAALEAPLGRDQLTARVIEAGREAYIERYDQHVRRALGIFRTAGDLTEVEGVCALNPDVTSGPELRNRALAFLLQLLQLRLEELSVFDPIRPREFASAIEAGLLTDALVTEIEPAIGWLYRPADGAPAVGADPEPVAAPADPDSGVVLVEAEVEEHVVPAPAPDEAPLGAAPQDDADYEFDGALPGEPDPVPGPESDALPPAAESPSGSMGIVNVARITSEAVAAAGEPAPAVPVPVPDADPAPAPDDEFALAVPVGDWLTEGDPLGAAVEALPEEPVTAERLVEAAPLAARVGPTPPPLPVAKITPPPLPQPPSEPV
ncbi:MAG: NYN domain-containing protein [Planctomycetes bacterium]|nr:NYN domain-containing protein [Planctomycetota bacterium]